ncbi:MAG: lytic transglycosylase domain-containing protein [Bacteroidales bacterium]|nr:lytic transglycosylase domain-containing protein [Bacteroidales bacterium]
MNKFLLYLAATGLMLVSASVSGQGIYTPPAEGRHPTPPPVPTYSVFCGDTIRFDTEEKYERMDRELMNFTFMHTTSSLMLKRSGKYFPLIERVLKEKGVPDDFKYLMVIESNLDPKALSSAGAAGLWQFTKATAREYGMMVNTEVDERYNIAKETEAACQYILKAYSQFKDWFNVAASYNCGMGGMSRRLAEQKQESFSDLWMPEETSRYVYRILAAKMLFADPAAFGFEVKEKYPFTEPLHTVTISGSINDLVEFAQGYGLTYAELKRANLWLRDSKLVNKEQRTYSITIPRPGTM